MKRTTRVEPSCSITIAARPAAVLVGASLLVCGAVARPALAGDLQVNDQGIFQLAQASAAPLALPSTVIPPPALPPNKNPYALADDLKIRGWAIPLPGAADTADLGLFGVRNALAEEGISYLGISASTFQDNMLRHQLPAADYYSKHGRENQLYSGQLPTYTTQTTIYANYDLRRYGIPDGQITLGFQTLSTNWTPGGPDGFFLAAASYYQTLFNKKVEIKVGALNNTLEFLGVQIGGSLANGVFGPNASIPIENGSNSSAFPTYGVNVKVNFAHHLYTKATVQRALDPDGSVVERTQNPTALNLKVNNAGLFILDEVGYQTRALPGQMSTWIRGGANVTTSRYRELTNTLHREQGEFGLYLLADRQILQTAPRAGFGSARRGVYAGFSVEHAPSYFNAFTTYYEGRLYGFGLIPGRPNDLVSLVTNHSDFSGEAVDFARSHRLLAHDGVTAVTVSYGAGVLPGVNINVGVGFTDHPTVITYNGSTGSALNVLLNTVIFL